MDQPTKKEKVFEGVVDGPTQEFNFNIVLVDPEIPNNAGNIGRTCVGSNCRLHFVGKLGFEINDKELKRAGLDYWQHLSWQHHRSWTSWWDLVRNKDRVFYFSTHASGSIYTQKFRKGDWFVFGPETRGLSPKILKENDAQALRIPQLGPIRSLNLSNAVSVVIFEGIRQLFYCDSLV